MNDIAKSNSGAIAAISIGEIEKLAQHIASSRMFGIEKVEQAVVLMLLCQSDGLNPIEAVRRYHIIQGRPAMRADAMLATYQAHGGKVAWGERTNEACEAVFTHDSSGPVAVRWTIEDARKAKLLDKPGNWHTYPRQMLTARVISEGVRTSLPGVVAGIYTPEETEDFAPLRTDPEPSVRQGPPVTAPVQHVAAAPASLRRSSEEPQPPPQRRHTTEPNRTEAEERSGLIADFYREMQAHGIFYLVRKDNGQGERCPKLTARLIAHLVKSPVYPEGTPPPIDHIRNAIGEVAGYAHRYKAEHPEEFALPSMTAPPIRQPLRRTTPEPMATEDVPAPVAIADIEEDIFA